MVHDSRNKTQCSDWLQELGTLEVCVKTPNKELCLCLIKHHLMTTKATHILKRRYHTKTSDCLRPLYSLYEKHWLQCTVLPRLYGNECENSMSGIHSTPIVQPVAHNFNKSSQRAHNVTKRTSSSFRKVVLSRIYLKWYQTEIYSWNRTYHYDVTLRHSVL
jgi:hypothetical protein